MFESWFPVLLCSIAGLIYIGRMSQSYLRMKNQLQEQCSQRMNEQLISGLNRDRYLKEIAGLSEEIVLQSKKLSELKEELEEKNRRLDEWSAKVCQMEEICRELMSSRKKPVTPIEDQMKHWQTILMGGSISNEE